MRLLIVIAVLVGAIFMILFVLTDLARELSRVAYHSPPDLDGDDLDIALDGLDETAPPVFAGTEQRQAISVQNRIAGARDYNFAGNANALDDLRSAF
jgi:hypothetical protein